jgi:ABC-type nitrate/sulfonate/bicarbonate transport system permease component
MATDSADIATPDQRVASPKSSNFRALFMKRERLLIGLFSVAVFLVLWQVSADNRWVNPLFTSSPSTVLRAGRQLYQSGQLMPYVRSSGELFLYGFLLSVIIAIPLGVAMGWYRRFDAVMDPFVSILYATPRIALIPLVLVWAGIGFQSRLIVVVLSAVFPLLINTVAGVRATDPQLLQVANAYTARDLAIFRTIVLPGAVPYIVAGLRHAINQALIGVVVAEFFAGNVGLGAMITSAGLELRTDIALLGVLVIAASSLILTGLLKLLERRLTPWRD